MISILVQNYEETGLAHDTQLMKQMVGTFAAPILNQIEKTFVIQNEMAGFPNLIETE